MGKLASSASATPRPPSKIGRLGSGSVGAAVSAPPPPSDSSTLKQRLEAATRSGALSSVPAAYADFTDWQTIHADDPFARLYLAADLHVLVKDEHVTTNARVLTDFWQQKRNLMNGGERGLDLTYSPPGTIAGAHERLAHAAEALATAAGRTACYEQLEKQRRIRAGKALDEYMGVLLDNDVIAPAAIKRAVDAAALRGFTPDEAPQEVPARMRASGFLPIRAEKLENKLLATWTKGGKVPADQPTAKVLGREVYSLAEAGRVIYDGLVAGDEKALRNSESLDYLTGIASDLRERDTVEDLKAIAANRKLDKQQRRLESLYLLGPELPFHVGGGLADFDSPAALLTRAASSARDFAAAENAFRLAHLPIWVRAGAPGDIKAALPEQTSALAFREFLHHAAPSFPLWIGDEAVTDLPALAAYILRDEESWKMVYGTYMAGYLTPWLQALDRTDVLDAHQERLDELLGARLNLTGDNNQRFFEQTFSGSRRGALIDRDSEIGRKLTVQALLEAFDQDEAPELELDHDEVLFIGQSGETITERTLTFTNPTGGYQRVLLKLEPALDGVMLDTVELFFDQRAPGQQVQVTMTANAALMPRDGQHHGQLHIQTAYGTTEVLVRAEAVFPKKLFAVFVGGAAAVLAIIFGGVRYLLGRTIGEEHFTNAFDRGKLTPFEAASRVGDGHFGSVFFLYFMLFAGLCWGFSWILVRLSKSSIVQ